MSFIPQTPIDPAAVTGSLRVLLKSNVHVAERWLDAALDTASDIAHQAAVCADTANLAYFELQQDLIASRSCRDIWAAHGQHHKRVSEGYFNFVHECFAAGHRASGRLEPEVKDAIV